MTISTTSSISREIRTIALIPRQGQRIFSVNLAMVDVGEFWRVAERLGFCPELVNLRYSANQQQVHALLWEGAIADTPADLEAKFDDLAEQINADAIYYAAGQSQAGWAMA